MFSLAISCLTTPNSCLDLTFQVPMQYCFYSFGLFPSPITSTTVHCFHFGRISSFFLELFLHSSSVAYWASTNLRSSSFSVLFFAFSYCSWDSQDKNTEVVCHSLFQWELSTMTHPSWVALHGMAHSFIELDRAVIHVISLVSFV